MGYYRASLNGDVVGDHQLDPLWTLPNKRVFYHVYDVTEQLSPEDNCLGVSLGNGWYNPLPLRLWGRVNLRERLPVGRPQFIARLLIEYADGSSETLVSDASWKFTRARSCETTFISAKRSMPARTFPAGTDPDWTTADGRP